MRQVVFFIKNKTFVTCTLFLTVGIITLGYFLQRDKIISEHVGSYLTYVVTSEIDLIHPQAWIIRFKGKEGVLERFQVNCNGKTSKMRSEHIQVLNYLEGYNPIARGKLVDSTDSLESYKFAVKFQVPNEQDLQCTLTFLSKEKWPLVTCFERSNVFRYTTMKISDQCENKIRKLLMM